MQRLRQTRSIEKGNYFNRLMKELGMSENALAKRLGLPRTHIQQCRAVASGAPELHKALAEGQITFSHARTIAQAAPGEHKTQVATLKQIQTWISNGRTVTEADTRAEAEKIIRRRLEGDLKNLGWQINGAGDIWAPSERPRAWTGAEMLEAVKTQRRPGNTPIEGEVSAADLQALQWQHDQISQTNASWIGLRKAYSGPWTYLAPSEVPALAQTIRAAMEALQARVKPHGFRIEPGTQSYTRFEVKGKHISQTHYSWVALEGCVKQIEAGELVDKPREQQQSAPARQPVYSKCEDCKKPAPGGLMWVGGKNLCSECRAPIFAAREAAAQVARQKADQAIGAWLRSAPAGAVPLVYAALVGDALDEDITIDGVLDAVGSYVRDLELEADDDEPLEQYAPSVAKLLAGANSAPGLEPSVVHDMIDTMYDQIEYAEPEPTTIGLLLGDIPADSPLAPIEAAVINIHQWCRISGASASDEEIAVNLAELRTISDDLDGLSADENITDEQFEMLSTAIGKLATALRELREERAVAA